jgi:hypothetical protein
MLGSGKSSTKNVYDPETGGDTTSVYTLTVTLCTTGLNLAYPGVTFICIALNVEALRFTP